MSKVRFDHVAIAVERLTDAPPVLVGALGGVPAYGAPSEAYNFGQWRYDGGGRIEILEPTGDDGFLHRFLAQHGPGVHHVTFKVPDIYEARDRARSHGYEIVGFDDSLAEWKTFFLHPKQALGIVVQVAQASGRGPRAWTPPPGPASAPPPVRLLGLRMRARSPERAETQWVRVLLGERMGATATESSSDDRPLHARSLARTEMVYRWPGSPMRIVVELDPMADEGPIALEYASDREALPPTPAPGLGAVFARVSDGRV